MRMTHFGIEYRITWHAKKEITKRVCTLCIWKSPKQILLLTVKTVMMSNDRNIRISDGWVYAYIRKGLGMHLVIYTNCDTVPFLLLVQYKGALSEIKFIVTLFSNAGIIFLSFLQILCIPSYIKGGIAYFC